VRIRLNAPKAACVGIPLLVAGVLLPVPAAASWERDLFVTFDGGAIGESVTLDSIGTAEVDLSLSTVGDGAVTSVPHAEKGFAARLERFRRHAPATPAVIIITPAGDDVLDPGAGSFRFGAEFNLDADSAGTDSDDGDNLIQRGLWSDGSQYKIQVDDQRPSCLVRGSEGLVEVPAGHDVEPGSWYRARCTREDDTVTLRLVTYDGADGSRRKIEEWSRSGDIGKLEFPATLPLSVGGKVSPSGHVLPRDSDQFNGLVDNAFFDRI